MRCFYQSLLYNSKFGLAPEIIIEDFSSKILCLQMKSKFIARKNLNIKVCVGFSRTTMKLIGKFLRCRRLSLVRIFFQYRVVLVLYGIAALIY